MNFNIIAYTAVLALVNFLFVHLVERHTKASAVKPVYRVEGFKDQRAAEIRNGILTTPVHALLFFLFCATGVLELGAESLALVTGTFLLTFLWTEIWHYVSHVAMHWRQFHFIHREHHKSRVTGPWSSVSFSLLEKFIFSAGILGLLSIVSRWTSLSALGIFLYYCLYFFTNTLGHANFEFRKAGYYDRTMGKIFNSPTYHAMHHARYTKNFGLLTPWLDRAFNTAWHDVPAVQTRAASDLPLESLNERLGSH